MSVDRPPGETPFDTGSPYSARELSAAINKLVAEGNAQLRALPLAQFFEPQGDRWSPAEHIRHLRKSTAPVATALRVPRWILLLRFGRVNTTSRDFVVLRETYRKRLAAGGQAGGFAPSAEPPPADPASRRTQILDAWAKSVRDLDSAIPRWSESALDRAYLPHPLLGKLTVREMLEFTVYHTSHHLRLIDGRLNQVR